MVLFHFVAMLCFLSPGRGCGAGVLPQGLQGGSWTHPGPERWHCSRPPLGSRAEVVGQEALFGVSLPSAHQQVEPLDTWDLCRDFWEADQPQKMVSRICVLGCAHQLSDHHPFSEVTWTFRLVKGRGLAGWQWPHKGPLSPLQPALRRGENLVFNAKSWLAGCSGQDCLPQVTVVSSKKMAHQAHNPTSNCAVILGAGRQAGGEALISPHPTLQVPAGPLTYLTAL